MISKKPALGLDPRVDTGFRTRSRGLGGKRLSAMAHTDLVQAFEARLKMYSLDGRALSILAETWPVIEPTLDRAIAEIITAVRVLPRVGEIIARNAELYKKLEAAHFRALLGGKLDGAYAESCRHTVAQEAAIGLDARVRSTAGSYVLQAALDALARKYWFSAANPSSRKFRELISCGTRKRKIEFTPRTTRRISSSDTLS